jgi:hypothetical protein
VAVERKFGSRDSVKRAYMELRQFVAQHQHDLTYWDLGTAYYNLATVDGNYEHYARSIHFFLMPIWQNGATIDDSDGAGRHRVSVGGVCPALVHSS